MSGVAHDKILAGKRVEADGWITVRFEDLNPKVVVNTPICQQDSVVLSVPILFGIASCGPRRAGRSDSPGSSNLALQKAKVLPHERVLMGDARKYPKRIFSPKADAVAMIDGFLFSAPPGAVA